MERERFVRLRSSLSAVNTWRVTAIVFMPEVVGRYGLGVLTMASERTGRLMPSSFWMYREFSGKLHGEFTAILALRPLRGRPRTTRIRGLRHTAMLVLPLRGYRSLDTNKNWMVLDLASAILMRTGRSRSSGWGRCLAKGLEVNFALALYH